MSKKDIKEMEKEIAGTDLFTKYEDVKNMKTEEYFNNNQFSIDAFRKKYALIENPHETYVQSVKRVCDFIASVEETEEMRTYWSKRWFHEIYNDWWHPAGSIMQGAGSGRKVSLANCSTISLGTGRDWEEWDSLEGIIKNTTYSVAKAAAYRQGTGIDFSRIRPEGTSVLNSANKSTGVIHWMRFVDSIGNYVGQCLHPDTYILTEDGYKKVEEIVKMKYSGNVFSLGGETKVINWFKNPDKKIIKLITEYGDILKASPEHKILTYSFEDGARSEKQLKDIKSGDWIVCRRNDITSKMLEYKEIAAFNYEIDEYNNSNRLLIPSKYPLKMNENFAYILGIIYGDGCAYNKGLEIAFSNDWPEIMEKFNNCLYEEFGVKIGDYGVGIKFGGKEKSSGDCTKISLGRWFYNFFESIDCLKQRAGFMQLPEIIKQSPRSVIESFFAGLFDSDGYNSMTKRNVQLALIDKLFLSDLKMEMQKFGYVIKIREKIRNTKNIKWQNSYTFSFVGKRSLQMLSEVPSIKIQEGNLFGKYDRLKTPYLPKEVGVKYNILSDINGEEPLSDTKYEKYVGSKCDLYIQRVEEMIDDGKSETYDITVDDESHLFSANPFIVSNSGRRPAILISLNCKHPDIENFVSVKSDRSKIQNANLSVQCTDDFYKAVKNNEDWELKFEIPEIKKGQKVYIDAGSADIDCKKDDNGWYYISKTDRKYEVIKKTIKAKSLMKLIAKNMHQNAEPGIQNIDIAKKYSNSDYLGDRNYAVWSTNACCLIGDSLVITDRGAMSIKEINDIFSKNPNENILAMSYNIKDKKYEFKRIVAAWQERNDVTVELEIEENGQIYKIECSADHPIMTRNRGYIQASSLTEEDDIVIFK